MARKAFLVGINKYPAPNVLHGCINDVDDMRDLLMNKLSFRSEEILIKKDAEATRDGIIAGLMWLAEAVPGSDGHDVRVFQYSGHGSQVADTNRDEPDGADECLVPVDFAESDMLIDDHLANLYKRVPKTSALILLLDSCHSGTGQKAELPDKCLVRSIDPTAEQAAAIERAHEAYVANREAAVRAELRALTNAGPLSDDQFEKRYTDLMRRFDAARSRYGDVNNHENNILLAACRDNQTSADAYFAGRYNGAFTRCFLDAVAALGPQASYRAVVKETGRRLVAGHFIQVPQLEARAAVKDRPLFSPLA